MKSRLSLAIISIVFAPLLLAQSAIALERKSAQLRSNFAKQNSASEQTTYQEALQINQQALILFQEGKYSESEPLVKQSLSILKKLFPEDHPDVATVTNSLALVYNIQGRYAEAEPLYVEALSIRKRIYRKQDSIEVAQSLNGLASVYYDQGRYTEAEPLLLEALSMNKRLYPEANHEIALNINALALLYNSQGRYTEAEPLLLEALSILEQIFPGDHPDTAIVLNNIGLLYGFLPDKYKRSEAFFLRSLEMNKRLFPDGNFSIALGLNNLAEFYRAQGKYLEAESFQKEALSLYQKIYPNGHVLVATSLNNLALINLAQNKYEVAKSFFDKTLEMHRQIFRSHHPAMVDTFYSIGTMYQLQKQYSQATEYIKRSSELAEAIISENLLIGSEQQKKQFLNKFQPYTHTVLSYHLQTIPNNKEAAELALTTILRRKGRVLDITGQVLQTLRDNLDDTSQQLFTQLASTQTQLANLSSRPLPDDATQRQNIQTQQAELDQEIKTLEAQLSSRSAEFAQETTPVTIEAVQQAIPNNAALAEFIQYLPFDPKEREYSKPRYAVYVLLPNGQMEWQDLGEASVIDDKIQRFRTLLGNGGERGLGAVQAESGIDVTKEVARELDDLLMKPVRAMVGNATHLLLSPDSQLNTLPFAALVDEQDKYLVENYLITYLTSGRDLLRLQLNQNQDTSEPLLMANPIYSSEGVAAKTNPKADKEDDTRGRRSGELGKLKFASLPGTKIEGEAIKKLVPDIKVYTEQEASENNLKQTRNPEFLHLATHGFFLPPQEEELNDNRNGTLSLDNQTPVFSTAENPLLRSGLALAGFNQRDSGTEDGVLTALEVTGLNLRGTKLVVMSACETGLGDVQAGEGVYGLRRAFTLAGAQSQLMSLWSVDDDGTKDLMVEYYRRIQNGEARGEALRQVQLEMLKSEDRNHPFYWAAFIPSGSWLPLD